MAKRRAYIAGNWKMQLGRAASVKLAAECAELAQAVRAFDVGIFPSCIHVGEIARAFAKGRLRIGAQDLSEHMKGAHTGDVSAEQLVEAGVQHVLIGHSERRHGHGETDQQIERKLTLALACGMGVIVCVGETAAERKAGHTFAVVERQLAALAKLPKDQRLQLDIAYEPVWAIGTGESATPPMAQEVHARIRGVLDHFGDYTATRILYGGSVSKENAADLARQPSIDGFLVGGASLRIADFRAVIEGACATISNKLPVVPE